MKNIKFETKVLKIGQLAYGLLNNNYLVTFDSDVEDLASVFGYEVEHTTLKEDIAVGDTVEIGDRRYKILDISPNTNEFLAQQSHVSFHIDRDFDGPKQILLDGDNFPEITTGLTIRIGN